MFQQSVLIYCILIARHCSLCPAITCSLTLFHLFKSVCANHFPHDNCSKRTNTNINTSDTRTVIVGLGCMKKKSFQTFNWQLDQEPRYISIESFKSTKFSSFFNDSSSAVVSIIISFLVFFQVLF